MGWGPEDTQWNTPGGWVCQNGRRPMEVVAGRAGRGCQAKWERHGRGRNGVFYHVGSVVSGES